MGKTQDWESPQPLFLKIAGTQELYLKGEGLAVDGPLFLNLGIAVYKHSIMGLF